jgi:hypothetical protein
MPEARNSLRPASQYLKKEAQQHEDDAPEKESSSHRPFFGKQLLEISPQLYFLSAGLS